MSSGEGAEGVHVKWGGCRRHTCQVGRVQKAYSHFPDSMHVSFSKAKAVLKQWFEPVSRQYLFATEFQAKSVFNLAVLAELLHWRGPLS